MKIHTNPLQHPEQPQQKQQTGFRDQMDGP